MFCRHIDVVAIFVIALSMLAFSHLPPLRIAPFNSLMPRNAIVNAPPCPISSKILARFAYVLSR